MPGEVLHSLELGDGGWRVDAGRKLQVAGSLCLQRSGAGVELAGNSSSNTAFCINPIGLKEKWESG